MTVLSFALLEKRIRAIADLPERDQKSVLRMLDNTIRAHGKQATA